jgi:hypothetical protein
MTVSLYDKYKIPCGQFTEPLNTLRFILRKAELGKHLTNAEWEWLGQKNLTEAIAVIKSQEAYRDSLAAEIRIELRKLHSNHYIRQTTFTIPNVDSDNALIFYKVHNLEELSDQESRFVGNGYNSFIAFNRLKNKLGLNEEIPYSQESVKILSKIDLKQLPSVTDLEWFSQHKVTLILNIFTPYISGLCAKYNTEINQLEDNSKLQHFVILQKLEDAAILSENEQQFLKQNGYVEALTIAQKHELSKLKTKYHATDVDDDNPTQHLYKVLKKLDAGQALPDADLNYLRKRKLAKTIKFAFQPDADCLMDKIKQGHGLSTDDITWCKQHDFPEIIYFSLKKDYGIEFRNDTPASPLFVILEKLEAKERLSEENKVWLEVEKWCRPNSQDRIFKWKNKIFLAYHANEALFYEAEFQRTNNQRNRVEASSHWRKTEQPQRALEQTSNLSLIHSLKDNDLKAALLTTRGGALRDLDQLDDSEKCAMEAKAFNPKKHYPYTLLGALCYDTGRYDEGGKWFEEAVKRGAKPNDQDAEIRRILNKKKGKDYQSMIDHLLKTDPVRFEWVSKVKASGK